MKALASHQLGYIAGIIDGEGCVNLNIQKDSRNRKRLSTTATLRVATSNRELSRYLYNLLGGNTGEYKNNGYATQFYYWALRSPKEIGLVLEKLQPYLIIKQDQAVVFLEWLRIRRRRKRGEPIPQAEVELIKNMRNINRSRGNPGKPDSLMNQALRELDTNPRDNK